MSDLGEKLETLAPSSDSKARCRFSQLLQRTDWRRVKNPPEVGGVIEVETSMGAHEEWLVVAKDGPRDWFLERVTP